nr:hypothetical protein [Micromonospora sp. DSM 115978]
MAARVDGRTQVNGGTPVDGGTRAAGKYRRRSPSRAPDLGWPTKPWYGDVERVVGVGVVAF